MFKSVVIKTGHDSFDALCALGMAKVQAVASGSSVKLYDDGTAYRLEATEPLREMAAPELIDAVFPLPNAGEFSKASEPVLGVLDGALAVSFTTSGSRLLSSADITDKSQSQANSLELGIDKAEKLKARLLRWMVSSRKRNGNWLESLLVEYNTDSPRYPQMKQRQGTLLTLPLTLDSAFAYGTRQAVSDGLITDKSNIAMSVPTIGGFLAHIGAIAFLRAQRTNRSLVILYTPVPRKMTVLPDSIAPRLEATSLPAEIAIYCHWINSWRRNQLSQSGVIAQVLQTQGLKQSFPLRQVHLSNEILDQMGNQTGRSLAKKWLQMLSRGAESSRFDIDLFADWLRNPSSAALTRHLVDVAAAENATSGGKFGLYNLEEVRTMMGHDTKNQGSMASILGNEQGTIRFGRALRLLAEQNHAAIREILEELESVQSRDHLIRILSRSVQISVLAKADSNFIIVPAESDLAGLYDDIAQFGVRDVASALLILASLRYPSRTQSATQDTTNNPLIQPSGI